jgi:hypothetical protein
MADETPPFRIPSSPAEPVQTTHTLHPFEGVDLDKIMLEDATSREVAQRMDLPLMMERGEDGAMRIHPQWPEPEPEPEPEPVPAPNPDPSIIPDMGRGLVHGAATGAGNMNALVPIPEGLNISYPDGRPVTNLQEGMDALGQWIQGSTGVSTEIDAPQTLPGQLASGVGQALPGMIPAVRAMKAAGHGAVLADIVGGFVGDMATSSEPEAKGIIELVKMVPSDKAVDVATALSDFITDKNGDTDEMKARILAGAPGIIAAPVVDGLVRLAATAKKSGVGEQMLESILDLFDE